MPRIIAKPDEPGAPGLAFEIWDSQPLNLSFGGWPGLIYI
jgi:hypothetical protein